MLGKKGYPVEAIEDGRCIGLDVEAGEIDRLCIYLNGALTGLETVDTNALFLESRTVPDFGDIADVRPLNRFIAFNASDWLGDLIDSGRIDSLFQPIFRIPESGAPTEVFAHECLARGRDAENRPVAPGFMFSTAVDADLLFPLDRAARAAAVRNAAAAGIETNIFINFTPSSVYDPANCLRNTVTVVEDSGLPRDRFVFEVVESEQVRDVEHLAGILAFYRRNGFRVALDDVGAGYASLNMLPTLKPDFVKIDRELVSGIDHDPAKPVIVRGLCDIARELGIGVIAEGIETEAELEGVRLAGADYAQGYHLARPSDAPWRG
ncbi:MAG: EAL domain-containing protein [Acetobacterales bacterium]